ncbi:aldehyde dehydrogenase [Thozetella sp. PMI_491]|nr:aldehyde dehydrogenase [Thozetella sp. PMI_491]
MAVEFEGRLFINNEFRASSSDEKITVTNPFDQTIVASSICSANAADVDAAVEAASVAFEKWRKTPPIERARLMHRLADLVEGAAEDLGRLETIAMGAPKFIAEHGAKALAASLRYYAGWADKIGGEVFPDSGDGAYRMVTHEPLGVCGGIAAWNATFLFIGWKVAPAIAAGNTYVFKVSEKSPLGALALGRLVVEAGFPPGVINFINGTAEAGNALASHMKVAKISFTGSTATGRRVQIAAASSNLKKCTLELGGKSAALVFDDADIENALGCLSQAFLVNTAQVCAATTRLLVQDTISEQFIARLTERFKSLVELLGDPSSPETFAGPIVDEAQFTRVLDFINGAKAAGIQVAAGGGRHGDRGYFVEPTLLVNPPTSSSVYRDEIFGPVLCVVTFKTEAEAIAMANDTVYGLAASVFTSNTSRALRVSQEIVAGSVSINRPVVPDDRVPMGGMKESGYGREGGIEGIMSYLDTKTIAINMQV